MGSISIPTALIASAAVAGGTSMIASSNSSSAASSAADAQVQAAQTAAGTTMAMFNQTQTNVAPFIQLGQAAASRLGFGLGLPGYESGTFQPGPAPPASPPAPPPASPESLVFPNNALMPGSGTTGATGATGQTPQWITTGNIGDSGQESGYWAVIGPNGLPSAVSPMALTIQRTDPQMVGWLPGVTTPGPIGQAQAQPTPPTTPSAPPAPSAPLPGFGNLLQPFNPTMEDLAKTPGYQFTLGQGLQAVQNSYAAQGLGSSGAAIKGAANYAEGLASTTYQQQFNNYWTQLMHQYDMLSGAVATGENAGVNLGNTTQATSSNLANLTTGAGAAQAGGIVGSANALNAGLAGVSGGINNALMLNMLNQAGMFGGGGANFIDTTTPIGPS